jgi:hypothetical protein
LNKIHFDKIFKRCFIYLKEVHIFENLILYKKLISIFKQGENKMIRSGEEILSDIDATLDQLIENAQVIKHISVSTLYTSEVEAMQKTQESLLARLVHMNDLLKGQKKSDEKEESFDSVEQKILRFGKLNAQMINHVSDRIKRAKRSRQPRVRPHRRKLKIG